MYNTVKTIVRRTVTGGYAGKNRERNQKLPDCLPLRMVQKDENCYSFSEEKSGVRIWKSGTSATVEKRKRDIPGKACGTAPCYKAGNFKMGNGTKLSDLDNLGALCKLYGVTADYILYGEDTKTQKNRFYKKVKWIIFGLMSGSGAILCCLLPLFASMYQQSEFRTWGSCYTNANDYITECRFRDPDHCFSLVADWYSGNFPELSNL